MKNRMVSKSNGLLLIYFLITLILNNGLAFSQIGISTALPKTTLEINGGLSLRNGTTLNLINGNNNNLNLGTNPFSVYQIVGPTASFNITGIVPVSGANGQIVVLQNFSTAIMTLSHNSPNSISSNAIYVPDGKDLMVRGQYASVTLQYNATLGKWILNNKLNHVETWYSGAIVIPDSITTTLTVTSPGVTPTSGISINLVGFYSTPVSDKYNIYIEYIEAQTDKFVFRINNTNPDTQNGPNYSAVQLQYAYTIVK